MPTESGTLSPEEEAQIESTYVDVRAWGIEAADRTSHVAAASAMILAGRRTHGDTMSIKATAELLTDLAAAIVAETRAHLGNAEGPARAPLDNVIIGEGAKWYGRLDLSNDSHRARLGASFRGRQWPRTMSRS